MSVLNATGDPTLSEAIGKRLLTPGGATAPGIAPEIFPCVVLENDRPEMLYLASSGLFSRGATAAAGGAGTRSSVQLVNASPDTLVVVEGVFAAVASGLLVLYSIPYPLGVLPVGTQSRGQSRDTRNRTPANNIRQSSALVINDSTLSLVGGTSAGFLPQAVDFRQPFVLNPGGAMYLAASSDNVAISYCTFFWRERRLNPSEQP